MLINNSKHRLLDTLPSLCLRFLPPSSPSAGHIFPGPQGSMAIPRSILFKVVSSSLTSTQKDPVLKRSAGASLRKCLHIFKRTQGGEFYFLLLECVANTSSSLTQATALILGWFTATCFRLFGYKWRLL